MWKEASDEEKQPFVNLYNKQKEAYDKLKAEESSLQSEPKKPITSYVHFCQAKREAVKAENPKLGFGDLSKKVRFFHLCPNVCA